MGLARSSANAVVFRRAMPVCRHRRKGTCHEDENVLGGAIAVALTIGAAAAPSHANPISAASGPQSFTSFENATAGSQTVRSLWSRSNQFGTAQAWMVSGPNGADLTRIVFTSLNGASVVSTFSPSGIAVVYPYGDVRVSTLSMGQALLQVSVTPGSCAAQPGNITAATGSEIAIKLDATGHPAEPGQQALFNNARSALLCRDATVLQQMKAFATTAGVPISSGFTTLLPATPAKAGTVHTDGVGECAADLALAAAAAFELDAAMADPAMWEAVPALERAYMAASASAAMACSHADSPPHDS